MKNIIANSEDIISRGICGFRQYILSQPVRLSYVSENLCEMTGFSREELSEGDDAYSSLIIHPADREKYSSFLSELARSGKKILTIQYRVIKKNGAELSVSDTVTVTEKDGVPIASSVLTDITELKNENGAMKFLNDTVPCGFLRYTCEDQPKLTYINRRMLELLRFPVEVILKGEVPELYRDNIFFMIPPEERKRFSKYLERVYEKGVPIAGEMTVQRYDGTKAFLFGWVTKSLNEQGEEEFQSACMDVTESHRINKDRITKQYIKALTEVYDKIFVYDFSSNTVKCLHSESTSFFKNLENIPMQMEEVTENWIVANVCADDREKVGAFFRDYYINRYSNTDEKPPQIRYKASASDGNIKVYNGIFIKMDETTSLYCCRSILDEQEADELRSENVKLKNMQELVMKFTEGIVAFEVEDGDVKPLYTSDNVCNFFGYTKEEWLSFTEKKQSLSEFISQSSIEEDEIKLLFEKGKAEFVYYDMTQNAYRRIKAICSENSSGGRAHRFVMLYNIDPKPEEPMESAEEKPAVSIRTFGYFDVFVGERPIAFRSQKSKELFALLVDRRGGYVSSDEAIGYLWEDEPVSPVTLARYRKVALRLKNILEEYGIAEVVESVDGKRRIVTEKVKCDLYDYLSGKEEHSQSFKGSYLTNYSWGESTLAELMGNIGE